MEFTKHIAKWMFLTLASLCVSQGFAQSELSSFEEKRQAVMQFPAMENDTVLVETDVMPVFPGCESESEGDVAECNSMSIIKWITKNIKNPQGLCVMGSLYVKFIVDSSGEVRSVEVLRGLHPSIDAEVIKAAESLPTMIPAVIQEKRVAVELVLPISCFKLE